MDPRPEHAANLQNGHNEIADNVFTLEDIQSFYRLYRDGRNTFEPQYLTDFTAIEDFIVYTRRNYEIVPQYETINIVTQQDENAELMRTWLTRVVPSCVYRQRSDFVQTGYYNCCFECMFSVSCHFDLIRHYREQHFAQMPPGIFGERVIYYCEICRMHFMRESHLNTHLISIPHISKMS